ncbi:hypothetical protein [Halocalculus aciditolerans]|uniref:Uncharacterized protein n=1 Tax=Halocalculus aciditolerans TaxID=1383812 RepID=A0A830FMT9_9EURY|nr:hypothetical protein [Halocalculus aciditolerans]GGL62104.1 hypothetical protein GCM10009039_20330 [Halocalculus aciditolerans]
MSETTVGSADAYRPGYCNIGREQRRQRYLVSAAAFGAAAVYVAAYLAGYLAEPLLLGVFIPLSIGYEWLLQAYTAFCVRLAFRHRYDFSGDATCDCGAGRVSDAEARRADQLQATKITAVAVLLAAVTTAALAAVLF